MLFNGANDVGDTLCPIGSWDRTVDAAISIWLWTQSLQSQSKDGLSWNLEPANPVGQPVILEVKGKKRKKKRKKGKLHIKLPEEEEDGNFCVVHSVTCTFISRWQRKKA
ncbi:uncharacterized protein LOC116269507 [Papio anubis]|uniref:uncharacterized protein LOC116269507 n=1 Tax=Papio anubis TaxID=9555 RepID=UPI0012AD6BE3|nr:uncharacterized protein LOC116269507 [Papio anubis]